MGGDQETMMMVTTLMSTEVVKGSMDMIWPAVDCGVTFSSMGITLALIRRQLKELDKKLDLILEKDRKVALDKLSEAMISLENRNHEAARDNFQRALDKANEGFHQCRDNLTRLQCGKIRLFCLLMIKTYEPNYLGCGSGMFLPFIHVSKQLKTEIAETMKYTVDDMLKEMEEHKDQDKKM